jgi:drug/metabolite transporter (DMT)-like permease
MLAAGVAWGVYSLRGRSAPDPLGRTAANFALAAPVALVLPLFAHGPARATGNGLGGVGLAVLSGALASGLGYAGWYAALPGLTRARAGIVQLAVPALAALGGVAFLGERPSVRLVASAALILGGVGLAVLAHATPTRRNAA